MDRERAILESVASILSPDGRWCIIEDDYRIHERWSFYVALGRHGTGVRVSIDLHGGTIVFWRNRWYPGIANRYHPMAVFAKLDLNDPRSLTRRALRAAYKQARMSHTPLESR
jgi:hypothetical protein